MRMWLAAGVAWSIGIALACGPEDVPGVDASCAEYCMVLNTCLGNIAGPVDSCTDSCVARAEGCTHARSNEIKTDLEQCADAGCGAIQACGTDAFVECGSLTNDLGGDPVVDGGG